MELESWKDGWKEGVSNDSYHDGPGESSTDIKNLLLSPAHYKCKDQFEETDPLIVGSAFHEMMLEAGEFVKHFEIVEPGQVRSKKKKEEAAGRGVKLLTAKQGQDLREYQRAVNTHPQAGSLYRFKGEHFIERAGYYRHPSGILLKIKPDVAIPSMSLLWDFKTMTMRGKYDLVYEFTRQAFNRKYHISAAFYLDVANKIEGAEIYDKFLWIVISKEPPYLVGCFMPDTELMFIARNEIERAIGIFQGCTESGKWPKPDTGEINIIGPPSWYRPEMAED